MKAISTTKQTIVSRKQTASKMDTNRMQSGSKMKAKAWNMLEGMVLLLRH
jgi:hypothetical protein